MNIDKIAVRAPSSEASSNKQLAMPPLTSSFSRMVL